MITFHDDQFALDIIDLVVQLFGKGSVDGEKLYGRVYQGYRGVDHQHGASVLTDLAILMSFVHFEFRT